MTNERGAHERGAHERGAHARGSAHGSAPALIALRERRADACRLTPDRALATLEDAERFLAERGMLTRTPDCSLPSLFGACHEPPYAPGRGGFGEWPATKWWWGHALAERPGVWHLKVHRGKSLFLSRETLARVAPLCREELARAARGGHGPDAARLVAHLAAAGPASVDDLKRELALTTASLRALRGRLERVGAVVTRQIPATADAASVGADTNWFSMLYRWDQLVPTPPDPPPAAGDALSALVVAGVRAAVVAPAAEVRSWFSWSVPAPAIDDLVLSGRLWEPEPGWVAAPESTE